MKKFDIVALAFKNFGRRKARSFLTILGVVIGTMAVVIMISIGQGLNRGFEDQVSQWGSLTEIQVYQGWSEESKDVYLNDENLAAIRQLAGVAEVMAQKNFYVNFVKGREISGISVVGIDPETMAKFDKKLYAGRLLQEGDTVQVVMGYMTLFNFYNPKNPRQEWQSPTDEEGNFNPPPFDPMAEKLKFTFDTNYGYGVGSGGRPPMYNVEVVGITAAGWNQDSYNVYMNYDTIAKLKKDYDKKTANNNDNSGGGGGVIIGGGKMVAIDRAASSSSSSSQKTNKYDQYIVKADSRDDVLAVQKAIKEMGFEAYSSMEQLDQIKEQALFIQLILGGIGAIAFLVSALGIANTMVMSTYERTKEIGIMKVIGCRLGDIRSLFLSEAGIIGFFGGVLGIVLSFGVSLLLNIFLSGSLFGGGMGSGAEPSPVSIIPFWLVVAGILISTFVGIVSGLYPAIRAMRLSAIEAIRNE